MLTAITNSFKSKWQHLTRHSGSKRLSWFSIVLVFSLDAYILTLLFDGVENAARTIEVPYSQISTACREMSSGLLDKDAPERVERLRQFTLQLQEYKENTILEFNNRDANLLPICVQIRDRLLATVRSEGLEPYFDARAAQEKEIDAITSSMRQLKATYSEALLEKAANQKRSDSILPVEASKIKKNLDQMAAELAAVEQQRTTTVNALIQYPAITAYFNFLGTLPLTRDFAQEGQREQRAVFWYPFKIIAAQAGFLLPLLLLAILWNKHAIKKMHEIQTLISAHTILVCAVPILMKVMFFIRELLPDQLLYELLNLLNTWKLGFVWYYLLVFACIGAGMTVIYAAQRTLFSAARLRAIRLRRVQCHACGEKIQSSTQACCESCGAGQSLPCAHCGHPRRVLAFHCGHCGNPA